MNNNKGFSLIERMKSFKYAFQGFKTLFTAEHNARVHLFFGVLAIIFGVYFNLDRGEWLFVLLAIVLVFAMELMNSAIEYLADTITKEINPGIKKAKDLAAASVLMSALFAVAVGLVVFVPKVIGAIF
ncbi:MAG: diacylglycerol kinase family protein [Salibacteraceae bacterium]